MENDKKIRSRILSMIIPITGENILQMTAGVVSMAMVGRISEIAVGAVGLSNIIFRIIWAIFKGISTGTSVYVAQGFGAKDNDKIRKTTICAFAILIFLSLFFIYITKRYSLQLLSIFNPTFTLLESANSYLNIIVFSLPFTALILLVSGVFQGMGNSKTPMFIVLVLNFFNIILSYVLIFGKLGLPALGLKGAAIAYVSSYLIAAIVGLVVLIYREEIFKLKFLKFKKFISFNEINKLVKFSMPTVLEMSFWQFASIIITRAILNYGETAYAAYQLGLQAESLSYMPAAGFGIAASTFVGQSIGSRDNELARKYMRYIYKYSIIITTIASLALLIFPYQIMRLLTPEIEVIALGAQYLFVMGLVQLPQNIAGVLNGALRGAGYPKISMLNIGVGLWGVRIPLVLLFTHYFNAEIYWIWIAMGIDLIVRFILSLVTFRKKDIYNVNTILN